MMNPNQNNILIRAWLTDNGYLAITTYSRAHGKHGRFFIMKDALCEWLHGLQTHPFYDTDCGWILRFQRIRDNYDIIIYWLSSDSRDQVRGIRQRFMLPAALLQSLLMNNGAPIKMVYSETAAMAHIDVTGASTTLRTICANKRKRRALSKAMRDCFKWDDDKVYLVPDFGSSFFFTTQSGCPSSGGLVLHETTIATPHGEFPKLFYSVHT